jgi:hypothetical protein
MDFDLEKVENNHNFLCFCSLICLLNGKKLNIPNIFLLVLKNDAYRSLLRYMLTIDNDFDLLKFFLEYDPKISKSKHITKFLNSSKGCEIKKKSYGFTRDHIQRVPRRVTKGKKPTIQKKKELPKSERDCEVVSTKARKIVQKQSRHKSK